MIISRLLIILAGAMSQLLEDALLIERVTPLKRGHVSSGLGPSTSSGRTTTCQKKLPSWN